MWDPIVSVPDHCLSFYYAEKMSFSLGCSSLFIASMSCSHSKVNGPVFRDKLVLNYLCSLLIVDSYAPEPNPDPSPCKYPCGYCHKAVRWITPGVCCDTCSTWYHQKCYDMKDCIFLALRGVSWECVGPQIFPLPCLTLNCLRPQIHLSP